MCCSLGAFSETRYVPFANIPVYQFGTASNKHIKCTALQFIDGYIGKNTFIVRKHNI